MQGGLDKPLMHWSSAQRNHTLYVDGKRVSNKALYAKRKTVAMAFFHFLDADKSRTVASYEAKFTSLTSGSVVHKNYVASSAYAKENKLGVVYNRDGSWINLSNDMSRRPDVALALGL